MKFNALQFILKHTTSKDRTGLNLANEEATFSVYYCYYFINSTHHRIICGVSFGTALLKKKRRISRNRIGV